MRTAAKKIIRHTSPSEILSALTESLAFQVQMILIQIEIAVFTAGAACVLLQGICDILSDKVKMF